MEALRSKTFDNKNDMIFDFRFMIFDLTFIFKK